MEKKPVVLVNGVAVEAAEAYLTTSGTSPNLTTTATLTIGAGAPWQLYFLGSAVSVQIGDYGPAPYRVVGLDEERDGQPRYQVRLLQVGPVGSIPDWTRLLYGAVFQTIMGRVGLHTLVELLESKGVLTREEFDARQVEVVDRSLVGYASEIVSGDDAEAMRNYVLNALKAAPSPPADHANVGPEDEALREPPPRPRRPRPRKNPE